MRNRLSEMWRSVDDATRKSYVERARKCGNAPGPSPRTTTSPGTPHSKRRRSAARLRKRRSRLDLRSRPPSAAAGLGPGQPVCCANDPQRRGVVVKQTAGSWLLVRFARGGETKARPSQLRALRSDEALTEKEKEELAKPFDPVARGVPRRRVDGVDAAPSTRRRWRGGEESGRPSPHHTRRCATSGTPSTRTCASRRPTAGSSGTCLLTATGRAAAVRGLRAARRGRRGAVWGLWVGSSVAGECRGRWRSRESLVHALKSHCGYCAACSMSASNAHIAALQELVAEPLRRGMPGDAERPQAKPSSGSMKDDDSRPRSGPQRRPRRRP